MGINITWLAIICPFSNYKAYTTAEVRQGFSPMSSSHRSGKRCARSSGMPLAPMSQHLTLRVCSLVRLSTTCGISPSPEFPLVYK